MDPVSGVLAGLGVFGIIGAVLIGTLLFVLIPIWAIFDCAFSKRETNTKVLVIILLFLTWTLGSLIYSIFFSSSRPLRLFTIVSLVVVVILTIGGLATLIGGAAIHSKAETEQKAVEEKEVRAAFNPDPVDPASVAPFKAIHFVPSGPSQASAAVADFTLAGPVASSALNIDDRVQHLVHDAQSGRYYGITQHEFGIVHPTSRLFEEIAIDPSLEQDFSWPNGLTMDPATGEIIILTSHVDSDFFSYHPATRQWKKVPTGVRGRSFIALAYAPEEQVFYAVEEPRGVAIRSLQRFNRAGADLGTFAIQPAIPIERGHHEQVQMAFSSEKVILIVPPAAARQGAGSVSIFAIDPRGGRVGVAGADLSP
jgi:hypothetical protein